MSANGLDGERMRRMVDVVVPACADCAHWKRGTDKCDAFPDGIPVEIFVYGNDHRKPYPSDHGVRFEPVKE